MKVKRIKNRKELLKHLVLCFEWWRGMWIENWWTSFESLTLCTLQSSPWEIFWKKMHSFGIWKVKTTRKALHWAVFTMKYSYSNRMFWPDLWGKTSNWIQKLLLIRWPKIRVLNPVKYNPVKIFTQQFLLNLIYHPNCVNVEITINDLIDSLSEINAFCLISASLTLLSSY